jgi:hypothetical protein
MMRDCARDVVEVREPSCGAFTSAGWQPANVSNGHRVEGVDQPVNQLAMLRAREQHLATLIARTVDGDQSALAELYDATNTLAYSLV